MFYDPDLENFLHKEHTAQLIREESIQESWKWNHNWLPATDGAVIIGYPHREKVNLDSYFITHITLNLKCTTDLNVRAKTIAFLEENLRVNLSDSGLACKRAQKCTLYRTKQKMRNCSSLKWQTCVL